MLYRVLVLTVVLLLQNRWLLYYPR